MAEQCRLVFIAVPCIFAGERFLLASAGGSFFSLFFLHFFHGIFDLMDNQIVFCNLFRSVAQIDEDKKQEEK